MDIPYTVTGKGPALVFLQGTGSINNETYPFLTNLLSKRFTIYSFDYPGFGESQNAKWTDELILEIIENLRAHYDIHELSILGYSIGAYFGLQYALKYPQDVKNLFLISPITTKFQQNIIQAAYSVTTELVKENLLLAKTKKRKFKLPLGVILPGKFIKLIRLFNFIRHIELTGQLHKISCNTYVFIGQNDRIIDAKKETRNAHLIKNAKIELFKGEGHYIIHNKANEIASSIDI